MKQIITFYIVLILTGCSSSNRVATPVEDNQIVPKTISLFASKDDTVIMGEAELALEELCTYVRDSLIMGRQIVLGNEKRTKYGFYNRVFHALQTCIQEAREILSRQLYGRSQKSLTETELARIEMEIPSKILESPPVDLNAFLEQRSKRDVAYYLGNRQLPKLLKKMQNYYRHEDHMFGYLGMGTHYDGHYSVTPLDVLPFIRTGGNGVHFGFLTDFKENIDLSEAPIVSVAPTFDPPVNIVAENLKEFLNLVWTTGDAYALAHFYATDEELKEDLEYIEEESEFDEETLDRIANSRENIQKAFGLQKISQPVKRMNALRKKRRAQATTHTADGVGLILEGDEEVVDFEYSKDPQEVDKFLSTANRNSRLKFYRQATLMYILSDKYDKEIKDLTIKYLKQDGLTREARILESY